METKGDANNAISLENPQCEIIKTQVLKNLLGLYSQKQGFGQLVIPMPGHTEFKRACNGGCTKGGSIEMGSQLSSKLAPKSGPAKAN